MHSIADESLSLCQGGGGASCAACCGLYNLADPSFEGLSAILRRRADAFSDIAREAGAIARYTARIESLERQERPNEAFPHCPFMAFTTPEHDRVGCLLHPMAPGNNGTDYRDLSLYGSMACRLYICPAHQVLEARHKRLLTASAPDWYLYGLLIPEAALLKSFFAHVEAELGAALDPEAALACPACLESMAHLYDLKPLWPYRSRGASAGGGYVFSEAPDPKPIDYAALGVAPSPFDPIFRALCSEFASEQDLRVAENAIRSLILDLVRALSRA